MRQKKSVIKWDVFHEIRPKMKENTRRIVLYYAPTHFHKKSSCFFRSEKSLKSNDVLCASRFRDDETNIQKHTLAVTGPMKTNIKWSSGWLILDVFQVKLHGNIIVIGEPVFCTTCLNGILQNRYKSAWGCIFSIPFLMNYMLILIPLMFNAFLMM